MSDDIDWGDPIIRAHICEANKILDDLPYEEIEHHHVWVEGQYETPLGTADYRCGCGAYSWKERVNWGPRMILASSWKSMATPPEDDIADITRDIARSERGN